MIGWLTQESKKCLRGSIKQPQSTIRERIDYYKESRGKEELGLSGVKLGHLLFLKNMRKMLAILIRKL